MYLSHELGPLFVVAVPRTLGTSAKGGLGSRRQRYHYRTWHSLQSLHSRVLAWDPQNSLKIKLLWLPSRTGVPSILGLFRENEHRRHCSDGCSDDSSDDVQKLVCGHLPCSDDKGGSDQSHVIHPQSLNAQTDVLDCHHHQTITNTTPVQCLLYVQTILFIDHHVNNRSSIASDSQPKVENWRYKNSSPHPESVPELLTAASNFRTSITSCNFAHKRSQPKILQHLIAHQHIPS